MFSNTPKNMRQNEVYFTKIRKHLSSYKKRVLAYFVSNLDFKATYRIHLKN